MKQVPDLLFFQYIQRTRFSDGISFTGSERSTHHSPNSDNLLGKKLGFFIAIFIQYATFFHGILRTITCQDDIEDPEASAGSSI